MDRNELRQEYRDFILGDKAQIERFKALCLRFLEEKTMADCFKLLPLIDIQKDFLKKYEDTDFHHLIKLFQMFEKYAASILAKPWCKDLHTIKVYTGFFKYNIERWLSSDILYKVFKLLGYERTSIDTLTLEVRDYENRVLAIGFELFLAHTQLYVLKSAEYLSPKYSMENILEGWLNTSGSCIKILEWLAINGATITEKSDFKSSTSDANVAGETMGSKALTIENEPLYYDEHGYTQVRHSVKYPPNDSRQHDYSSSSGFSSLRTSNVSDCLLYGDSDHTVSPPPKSGRKSDYSDKSAMVMKPLSFTNKLHELEHGGEFDLEMRKDASYPKEYVVSRGGNSTRENTGNGVTYIQARIERAGQILASRRAKGEQTFKLQNRDYASRKIGNDCITSTGMYREDVKCEDQLENKSTDDIQPSAITLLNSNAPSNPTNNCTDLGSSCSCYICDKPPAFGCEACNKLLCEECFERTPKRPCCENANKFYSIV